MDNLKIVLLFVVLCISTAEGFRKGVNGTCFRECRTEQACTSLPTRDDKAFCFKGCALECQTGIKPPKFVFKSKQGVNVTCIGQCRTENNCLQLEGDERKQCVISCKQECSPQDALVRKVIVHNAQLNRTCFRECRQENSCQGLEKEAKKTCLLQCKSQCSAELENPKITVVTNLNKNCIRNCRAEMTCAVLPTQQEVMQCNRDCRKSCRGNLVRQTKVLEGENCLPECSVHCPQQPLRLKAKCMTACVRTCSEQTSNALPSR